MPDAGRPAFYTVHEAARLLRVDPSTLYRALREDGFPAVRIRTRYAIPSAALHQLIEEAAESGGVVDAGVPADERSVRGLNRLVGGAW
ncbi:helix-turn-helix domain-containing protein [Saccharothrix sp.]|uniref:helix-turn-helix domain-containing protein n=1 Tax=Saccharothrix sp. TaxID=1873460 RepID=UPI0028122992|nr:helix-turn-helix domain-containing protein [Saccharothrix sp.]